MKPPVKTIIIVVVLGLLALGAWRAASMFSGVFDDLFAQSRALATQSDEAAAAVVAAWDPQALQPFATSDYFISLEQDGFAAWAGYRALPQPVTLKPCTVPSLHITNGRGTASASCSATFGTTAGTITFDYNNDSGDWKIAGMNIVL